MAGGRRGREGAVSLTGKEPGRATRRAGLEGTARRAEPASKRPGSGSTSSSTPRPRVGGRPCGTEPGPGADGAWSGTSSCMVPLAEGTAVFAVTAAAAGQAPRVPWGDTLRAPHTLAVEAVGPLGARFSGKRSVVLGAVRTQRLQRWKSLATHHFKTN